MNIRFILNVIVLLFSLCLIAPLKALADDGAKRTYTFEQIMALRKSGKGKDIPFPYIFRKEGLAIPYKGYVWICAERDIDCVSVQKSHVTEKEFNKIKSTLESLGYIAVERNKIEAAEYDMSKTVRRFKYIQKYHKDATVEDDELLLFYLDQSLAYFSWALEQK